MPPVVIAAGVAAVGAVGAAAISSSASSSAASAQVQAADAATQAGMTQYYQTREDLAPWRTQGAAALNQYSQLLGLPQQTPQGGYLGSTALTPPGYQGRGRDEFGRGGGFRGRDIGVVDQPVAGDMGTTAAPGAPDYSAFFKTPGYQFEIDEAAKASERAAAARGNRQSGGQLAELERLAQGRAAGGYSNYMAQLGALAGIGQTATVQTGQFGAQAAGQAGSAALAAGSARASGYLGSAQAWGQGIAGVGQAIGTGIGYLANRPKPINPYTSTPEYFGTD